MKSTILSLFMFAAQFFCCNSFNAQQSEKQVTAVPKSVEDKSVSSQVFKELATQLPPEMQSMTKALGGKWQRRMRSSPLSESLAVKPATAKRYGGAVPAVSRSWRKSAFERGKESYVFALQWWDKSTNSLRGMLCNNSGPAACNVDTYFHSSLKWDGKQLVIDLGFPQNDKKMMWHEVWSDITAASFTQTGDMGEVGGPLKRVVTIHGVKMAERPTGPAN